MAPKLNELETAVLETIIVRESSHSEILKFQMKDIVVLGRENSGAGFFTRLNPIHRQKPVGVSVINTNVAAQIEGLKNLMVFVLFADASGLLNMLEGASVAESTTSIDFSKASFRII